jgi:hypothetical protein
MLRHGPEKMTVSDASDDASAPVDFNLVFARPRRGSNLVPQTEQRTPKTGRAVVDYSTGTYPTEAHGLYQVAGNLFFLRLPGWSRGQASPIRTDGYPGGARRTYAVRALRERADHCRSPRWLLLAAY